MKDCIILRRRFGNTLGNGFNDYMPETGMTIIRKLNPTSYKQLMRCAEMTVIGSTQCRGQ